MTPARGFRFEDYAAGLAADLSHADQVRLFQDYGVSLGRWTNACTSCANRS
jgi:hypothetical protein